MFKLKSKLILLGLVMVIFAGGLVYTMQSNETNPPSASDNPLKVVTTTTMITDLLQTLGGEVLEVKGLMGPGIDPHLYQATEGDVRLLQEADAIFYNGLHLEGKINDLFIEMNNRGIATYAITDGIQEGRLMAGEDQFEGSHDPHIWFDVENWIEVTAYVKEQLIKLDPANEAVYAKNAEDYIEALKELNQYVTDRAQSLAKEQRVLITAHDAFQYFGRAYDFEVLGLEGISTESEASIADIRELADLIAERKIKAIFVETSVAARNIEALQQAVEARGFQVAIGGELYSDAMGDPGQPEGTYLGMIRYNIDTIVKALSE